MIRIRVSEDLKERLRRMKRPGETYDDVIVRLIEDFKAREGRQARPDESTDQGNLRELDSDG